MWKSCKKVGTGFAFIKSIRKKELTSRKQEVLTFAGRTKAFEENGGPDTQGHD